MTIFLAVEAFTAVEVAKENQNETWSMFNSILMNLLWIIIIGN